jgi:hypothetical protein
MVRLFAVQDAKQFVGGFNQAFLGQVSLNRAINPAEDFDGCLVLVRIR